jgi:hypothetical protein
MTLGNADIAMIVLLILAITVVYFGVFKEGSKASSAKTLDSACIAKAALQAFFNIGDKWDLSDEHEKTLLGRPTESEFVVWKENTTNIFLDKVTLERISHLMIIYRNLRTLLPSEDAANTWVKRANTAPLFSGDTALNYMLKGGIFELKQVHQYLDNKCL